MTGSGKDDARSSAADAVFAQYERAESAQYYKIVSGDGSGHVHYGVYNAPDVPTAVAADETIHTLRRLGEAAGAVIGPGVRVLDIGAGTGGPAHLLATSTGASVTCLNLCEKQNAVNRAVIERDGLGDLVDVVHGSFDDLPTEWTGTFDVVWSQDAICHAADKGPVFTEAGRVLKPGGYFMITDIMAGPCSEPASLESFKARLRISELLTEAQYESGLAVAGINTLRTRDLTGQLVPNYRRMLRRCTTERARMPACSEDYLETVKGQLRTEIEALREGEAQVWIFLVGRKRGAATNGGATDVNTPAGVGDTNGTAATNGVGA